MTTHRFAGLTLLVVSWACACAGTPAREPAAQPAPDLPSRIPELARPAPPPDVRAPPIWAHRLPSGVAYLVVAPGTGDDTVGPDDFIEYNLTAWRADGVAVDTNLYQEPRRLPLLQALGRGYREAFVGMRRGERRRVWVPARWAEANLSSGPVTYDLELVALTRAPAAPDDLAAPADARTTAGGDRFAVLRPGAGAQVPDPWDQVRFHLSTWRRDGALVDSSIAKGRPERGRVDQLAPGIREAIGGMVPGERRRLWLPAARAGADPARGDVVCDLELLERLDQPAPPVTPPDVAAPPRTARRTPRGVAYEVLHAGDGARPTIWDEVEIHYAGWTPDGRLFDTSIGKGLATYPVGVGVIAGWTEVFTHMVVGDRWRVWIPGALGHHAADPPRGRTVYEIELVRVIERPRPPPVPPRLAFVPPDARRTAGGAHLVVLERGQGATRPTRQSRVVVEYTGWTARGDLIDSSIVRGFPHTAAMADLMPGMIEALETMVVGQQDRVWIPHAFEGRPGLPRGTVVFDVKLVAIP